MPEQPHADPLWRHLPDGGAAVLLVLGASVLVGWIAGVPALVTWDAAAATPANGALGLMLFAMALLAARRLGSGWAAVALVPAAAGTWSLLEMWSWMPPGFDEWLWPHVLDRSPAPGRLAAAAALAFVLSGCAIALLAMRGATRLKTVALAGLGSLVGGTGLAAVLGHATGLTAATTLGLTGPIAAPLAVGLLVLGCSLVAVAIDVLPEAARPARWLPAPLIFACLAATAIVVIALHERETTQHERTLASQTTAVHAALAAELDAPAKALGRMAARIAQGNGDTAQLRQFDAQALVRDFAAVELVGRLDGALQWREGWTASGDQATPRSTFLNETRRTRLAERLREQPRAGATAWATRAEGGATLLLYAPVRRDGRTEFLIAEVRAERWVEAALGRLPTIVPATVLIGLAGESIRGGAEETAEAGFTEERELLGVRVRVTATSRPEPGLVPVVAASGIAFALLLGLVVDLAQKARRRQLHAERTAELLAAEDRERRQAEARLEASEKRLGLALEAGQVGTFDWDKVTGVTHFSAGAWRMLGYEPGATAARMASWDELIRKEDAAAAAREFPRGPQAGFREVEYRARNAYGEWRWILERAKAVAFGPDGAPRRIAGTFQDITARKEAEQALRVSQAEARKLAIVASATESAVAITDPDGAIEWVNDSLVQLTGCPREEAAGRALTDLFPPPPAGETAAAGVLREAFLRRLPSQIEISAVSRQGRVFRLQGEIRPVAGERGEIEKFIAVLHDVTVRHESECALRRATEQAEAATRAKSDFLAAMSHEIRTPMNGVIGLARLLQDSPLNSEQQDWARTIHHSGEALLTIINDILDFSKIESGRMELERFPFALADCVEEALELFSVAAGEKRLELAYWIAPGVPATVIGDVVRLRQVLVNLVGNAVKFTPAGRVAVEVRPGETAERLVFTVTDTGIGIPPERADALFRPFSQVDPSTTRRFGGTGLGLAICRRLVELMGGEIGVLSRHGGGSVFHFSITVPADPMAAAPEPTPAAGRRAVVVDDDPVAQRFLVQVLERLGFIALCFDSLAAARAGFDGLAAPDLFVADNTLPDGDGLAAVAAVRAAYPGTAVPAVIVAVAGHAPPREALLSVGVRCHALKPLRRQALRERLLAALAPANEAGAATAVPAPPPPAEPRASLADRIPLRVLLAEDNPVNKKVALRLLERLGYKAEAVGNGTEAVQAAGGGAFDLIFMDVQMPELDGLEATRRIRAALPAERQPAIIALTANAIAGDAELCRAAGMDDYLSKPVTPEAIHNAIVRRFGKDLGLAELPPGGLA